jgi:hypothetical protein
MATLIAEKFMVTAEVVADSGCKVNDSELAYWLLEHSGLATEEKEYVLAQAGEAYKLKEIRSSLQSLYPQDTPGGPQGGPGDSMGLRCGPQGVAQKGTELL